MWKWKSSKTYWITQIKGDCHHRRLKGSLIPHFRNWQGSALKQLISLEIKEHLLTAEKGAMMSTRLRLQGEMRGLVRGLRQLTMNPTSLPGNLNVNLAGAKLHFSSASPAEIPKKPITPWISFFKTNLPEYKKKHPGVKVSDLMSKMSEEWKKLPAEKMVTNEEKFEQKKTSLGPFGCQV